MKSVKITPPEGYEVDKNVQAIIDNPNFRIILDKVYK